jgi:acetyltransferase EpsM
VVEHDVVVGEHSHVGPAAAVGGGGDIGDEVLLGMGCRIRDHISVGRRARVAMGAVVVADVPPDTLVVGVPAKPRSVDSE